MCDINNSLGEGMIIVVEVPVVGWGWNETFFSLEQKTS